MTIHEIKDKLKQDKKLVLIFLCGGIGLIFLFISSITGSGIKRESQANTQDAEKSIISDISVNDMEHILEEKLSDMIGDVKGAGSAEVMISIASSGEIVYAENQKKESRDTFLSEDKEIVICKPNGNDDAGLVISIRGPDIRGVAVICDGGESAVVVSEIKKLVTSLFGIGSDRVYVGEKSAK